MYYAYKDGENIAGATTEEQLKLICKKLNLTNYTISKEAPKKPALSEEQQRAKIKNRLLNVVDAYMDNTVRQRGYDNIAKCVTYEGDEDEVFNAEGTAAKKWRSKVYRTCYNILADVEAGKRAIPTKDELLAELPVLVW